MARLWESPSTPSVQCRSIHRWYFGVWRRAHPVWRTSHAGVGTFIHVLADHQDELAKRFASRAVDKFSGVRHANSEDNIPRFDECVATFECATRSMYEEGDHVIVVAHVDRIDQREREPLLFWAGRFTVLETVASSRG